MTSCWSSQQYAYYFCRNHKCVFRNKNISRDVIHPQFEALLDSVKPAPQILEFTKAIMRDTWDTELAQHDNKKKEWEKELRSIDNDIEDYAVQLKDAPNKAVRNALYDAISKLDNRRTELEAKLESNPMTQPSFDQALGEALHLVSNPLHLWRIGDLTRKRLVQKMVFPERLSYVYNDNFRKPETALVFKALQGFRGEKSGLVEATGIEPATS